jgi:outer membrane receptor protein involved in Fe transport
METVVRRTLSNPLAPLACLVFCTCLLIAGSPTANAQGTRVEGVVRDATGASVPNAQVQLRAKAYSATISTDAMGAFVFENVPETLGTLSIAAKDMKTVRRSWSSASGAPVHVEIVLQPLSLTQRIMVTATRTETPLGETPVSDIQLSRDHLRATPALTLDDALRQVPGFSLFRRTSSRIANPSTLGVSLRGLGGTATSRALVLEDGIPLNDPFGSWVYWDRVPRESISSVEVAQEGASSLYGTSALSGVIQFLTRPAHQSGISLETSYGNQNTPNLSFWAGGEKGGWQSTFGGEVFQTDGYFLVPQAYRGSVDTQASSKHGTADLMIGRRIGAQNEIFARGSYLDDSRNNGTQVQINNIRLGEGAMGANLQSAQVGSLKLRFYGSFESYYQTYSAVATDRNTETLTNEQRIPAQGVGGSAVWTRELGKRQTLVAGFDEHEEIGHSNDILFSGSTGTHLRNTFSGGHQRTAGFFGEDLIHFKPGWLLSLSARYDHWRNFDGFSACVPFAASCTPAYTAYGDRSYDAFSPRATLMQQVNSHISWSASVYRAFRAPTLNELYRSFRKGTTVTTNNPDLRAERLTGGEAGVDVVGFDRRLELRGAFFFNEVIDPIANVTLTVTPSLTTAQKQNLGRTSAPGFEIDGVAHITNRLDLSAGYQYVNATVISFPADTSLVGLWVPQVPHNVLTFQARYSNPSRISFALAGRLVGKQFDDDKNDFAQGNFFVLDAMAYRTLAGGVEVFASAENLFNERYTTGFASATPSTVIPQLGLPIVARFGLRYDFPKR